MHFKEIPPGVLFKSDTLGMVVVRLEGDEWTVQVGGPNPGRVFWPNEIEDVRDWEEISNGL